MEKSEVKRLVASGPNRDNKCNVLNFCVCTFENTESYTDFHLRRPVLSSHLLPPSNERTKGVQ